MHDALVRIFTLQLERVRSPRRKTFGTLRYSSLGSLPRHAAAIAPSVNKPDVALPNHLFVTGWLDNIATRIFGQ